MKITRGGSDIKNMEEVVAREFWARVNKGCSERGMTQIELCSIIGFPLQSLRGAVHKGYMPKIDVAVHISEALEIPLWYLATGKDDETVSLREILGEIRSKIDDVENSHLRLSRFAGTPSA